MKSIIRSPLIYILNETIPRLMNIKTYNLINEYLNKWFYVSDENWKVKLIFKRFFPMVCFWDLLSFIFIVFLVIFTFLFKEKFLPKIIGLLLTYYFSLQRNLTRAKKLNNDIKLKNYPK